MQSVLSIHTHANARPGQRTQSAMPREMKARARMFLLVFSALFALLLPAWGQNILTYHNDVSRSGANTSEVFLNPNNVKSATFGKLFSYNVDGFVVAEPLYMQNVSISGATHNVVFVETQNDSVYAFDADNPGSGTPLWQAAFSNPANGVTAVPIAENGCGSVTGYTQVGIMGTPVIDASTGTLYVDVKTKEVSGGVTNYYHRLHALDITSGAEKFGGPVIISGSFTGPDGTVQFNALDQNQRPALLEANGNIYIAFGSNGCDLNAWGWLFSYNISTLQQEGVFNTSPDQSWGASIWEGGDGPAADINGNIYISTANGTFDVNTGGPDFAMSVIKFAPGNGLTWTDYFTPFDEATESSNDLDLGAGGVLLLPHQGGTDPDLLIAAGKAGNIYLINRDNMGQFNASNNNQIVQYLPAALHTFEGAPLYWNGKVYFFALSDTLKYFKLVKGLLDTTPIQSRNFSAAGVPAISSNGTQDGMVFVVRNPGFPLLSGMNAISLGEIYNSGMNPTRDELGLTAHFVTPLIAQGRVYVGTQTQLVAYGLFSPLTVSAGNNQTGPAGTLLPTSLSVQATSAYGGAPVSGIQVTFSDGGVGGTFGSANVVTDSNGMATTTYTLPTKAQTVTINVTSPNFLTASLTETAVAGSPAKLSVFSGSNQTGTVGTPLANPVIVTVSDSYGNPIVGTQVTYSDNGAGGSFSVNPVTTNLQGNASTNYTLPTKAQIVTISASDGTPTISFTETAAAGAPASMAVISGGGQTGTAGTTLPAPIVVGVKDSFGNNISGTSVTFSDGGAGGTFSANPVTTNSSGQASVNYTLPGTTGETITITASDGSVNVQFSEKTATGSASSIGIASGGGQTGTVGTALANPIIASVKDSNGNPVSGVSVTFSDGGVGGTFSANPVVTNSLGQASVTYTLPTTAQTITMTASTSSLSVQFSEKAVAGAATAIAVVSGGGQTGTVGTALANAIVVGVKDSFGNPISGASVTFSDGGVGGSFSANPVTTNTLGQASVTYTLPTKAQTATLSASTGSLSVQFSEKAVAGAATSIAVVSGGGQTGTVGSALANAIVIGVKDSFGNAVSGASVSFSDGGAGGSFSVNPVVTGTNGQVSTNYTLPTVPGTYTLTASTGSLSTQFSEKAVAGSPATMFISGGNQQTAATNTQLPAPLQVGVKDQFGNPVSGAVVTFTDNGAGGVFSSNTATTGTNGNASVTYTTGSTSGTVSITASVTGANSVNFSESVE